MTSDRARASAFFVSLLRLLQLQRQLHDPPSVRRRTAEHHPHGPRTVPSSAAPGCRRSSGAGVGGPGGPGGSAHGPPAHRARSHLLVLSFALVCCSPACVGSWSWCHHHHHHPHPHAHATSSSAVAHPALPTFLGRAAAAAAGPGSASAAPASAAVA